MFEAKNTKIEMTEGDYGIVLPIELEIEGELTPSDKFSFKIFKTINEEPIIEKVFSDIDNNTIEFQLTKAESELLEVGSYYYDIDWYQENLFLNNIIAKAKFKVLEKAGE